jgi:hypothetical protein
MFGFDKRAWRKALGISNAQRQMSRSLGLRLSDLERGRVRPSVGGSRRRRRHGGAGGETNGTTLLIILGVLLVAPMLCCGGFLGLGVLARLVGPPATAKAKTSPTTIPKAKSSPTTIPTK